MGAGEEQPFEDGLGPEGGWDVGRSVSAPGREMLGRAYPPLGLVDFSEAWPRLEGEFYEALYSWVVIIMRSSRAHFTKLGHARA